MMFNDWNEGPRNWKWMVPAALVAPVLVWFGVWWKDETGMWNQWAMVPLCLSGILLIAALMNLWLYVQRRWADIYSDVQVARNATPEVRMMEAAKGMHPEAVKALLAHRRTIWRIKYVARRELTDWVLDEAPTVHAGFVDFVLDHSNGVSLMAKHRLSEGSTKFDPEGVVTDYQQYDDLLLLMQQKLMVTQAFGNQAPHFISPWEVEGLRKRFGLVGEGEYKVDVEEEVPSATFQVPSGADARPARTGGNGAHTGASRSASVIGQALEGLEQTSQMKARTRELFGS